MNSIDKNSKKFNKVSCDVILWKIKNFYWGTLADNWKECNAMNLQDPTITSDVKDCNAVSIVNEQGPKNIVNIDDVINVSDCGRLVEDEWEAPKGKCVIISENKDCDASYQTKTYYGVCLPSKYAPDGPFVCGLNTTWQCSSLGGCDRSKDVVDIKTGKHMKEQCNLKTHKCELVEVK